MDRVIAAIATSLLCPQQAADPQHHHVIQTGEVLYRKVMAMPFFLRHVMMIALFFFNLHGFLNGGKLFTDLSLDAQRRQVEQWETSPLGPCREVMSFFRKMSVFIYFSLCLKNV